VASKRSPPPPPVQHPHAEGIRAEGAGVADGDESAALREFHERITAEIEGDDG